MTPRAPDDKPPEQERLEAAVFEARRAAAALLDAELSAEVALELITAGVGDAAVLARLERARLAFSTVRYHLATLEDRYQGAGRILRARIGATRGRPRAPPA